jgi:predicted GIY-YIG superfamily endonuclease
VSRERQLDLFELPQPLVEKLGAEFFRRLPESAGVYRFYGVDGHLLYVGKAKNLRARLGSYRADRHQSRKTRRLIHQAAFIEYDLCDDEAAALAQEARLIRFHRPKFNRMGVWTPPPWRLRIAEDQDDLVFSRGEEADSGDFGPFQASHRHLIAGVARLIWLAARGFPAPSGLPRELLLPGCGWSLLRVGKGAEFSGPVRRFFEGESPEVVAIFQAGIDPSRPTFDRAFVAQELNMVDRFWERRFARIPEASSQETSS